MASTAWSAVSLIGLAFLAASAAFGGPPPPSRAGASGPVSTSSKEVVQVAEFAIATQEKLVQAATGDSSVRLRLVRIDAAEQQIVAGINYRLRLTVALNDRQKPAQAVVWWQAWRTPDPYRLTSWTWT
ncbi:MAG: cystatin domain-containing protein [Cyanobium sp.]